MTAVGKTCDFDRHLGNKVVQGQGVKSRNVCTRTNGGHEMFHLHPFTRSIQPVGVAFDHPPPHQTPKFGVQGMCPSVCRVGEFGDGKDRLVVQFLLLSKEVLPVQCLHVEQTRLMEATAELRTALPPPPASICSSMTL